jgi:hypothetical protein
LRQSRKADLAVERGEGKRKKAHQERAQ